MSSLTDHLLTEYHDLREVVTYLNEVRRDMLENFDDFIPRPPDERIARQQIVHHASAHGRLREGERVTGPRG